MAIFCSAKLTWYSCFVCSTQFVFKLTQQFAETLHHMHICLSIIGWHAPNCLQLRLQGIDRNACWVGSWFNACCGPSFITMLIGQPTTFCQYREEVSECQGWTCIYIYVKFQLPKRHIGSPHLKDDQIQRSNLDLFIAIQQQITHVRPLAFKAPHFNRRHTLDTSCLCIAHW